jgi:hypothetical protein
MDGMNNLKHDSNSSPAKQYGYLTSIVSGIFLLILGFSLEGVLGEMSLTLPKWPYSLGIMLASAGLFVGLGFMKTEFNRWLGSNSVVTTAVALFGLFMVVAFIVPQINESEDFIYFLGLNHVYTNRAFLLVSLFLSLSMGVVVAASITNLTLRKWGQLLASFGLLGIAIVMVFGQADVYRLKMMIGKEHVVFDGMNRDGLVYRLPFAVKLISIESEDQKPELRIRNTVSGEVHLLPLKDGETLSLNSVNNFRVAIQTYLPKAIWDADKYVDSDSSYAVPAVFLAVSDSEGRELTSGWSSMWAQEQGQFLVIDNEWIAELVVVFNDSIHTTIGLYDSQTEFKEVVIGKSQSYRHKGWSIKQTGIDERFGNNSPVAETELKFDRWEELRYLLLGLLILGVLLFCYSILKK